MRSKNKCYTDIYQEAIPLLLSDEHVKLHWENESLSLEKMDCGNDITQHGVIEHSEHSHSEESEKDTALALSSEPVVPLSATLQLTVDSDSVDSCTAMGSAKHSRNYIVHHLFESQGSPSSIARISYLEKIQGTLTSVILNIFYCTMHHGVWNYCKSVQSGTSEIISCSGKFDSLMYFSYRLC